MAGDQGGSGPREKLSRGWKAFWAFLVGAAGVVGAVVGVLAYVHQLNTTPVAEATPPSTTPTVEVSSPPLEPPSPTPEPIVRTAERQVNPVDYNGNLRPGYQITETVDGGCALPSSAIYENENAYRCFFDSWVADPCFAFEDGKAVYCIPEPWKPEGVRLNLAEQVAFNGSFQLPRREPSDAWAIEIVDPSDPGVRWFCRLRLGAAEEIGGHGIAFGCGHADGTGSAYALGSLESDEPVWRILFQEKDATEIAKADVATAWY